MLFQRHKFDNIVPLLKISQQPHATLKTTIQFLSRAYEALQDVAPAYLVHYASAMLASFHFYTIPQFFPPQGPCSCVSPLPGMPHTSKWQASYYLGFHSKSHLNFLPKVAYPIYRYPMTLSCFLNSTYYYLELSSVLIYLLI